MVVQGTVHLTHGFNLVLPITSLQANSVPAFGQHLMVRFIKFSTLFPAIVQALSLKAIICLNIMFMRHKQTNLNDMSLAKTSAIHGQNTPSNRKLLISANITEIERK